MYVHTCRRSRTLATPYSHSSCAVNYNMYINAVILQCTSRAWLIHFSVYTLWQCIYACASFNFSAEVVHPPVDTVVYVGQNATFTCDVGSAADAKWKINGTFTRDLLPAVQNDVWTCPLWECGNYSLTIVAKLEYNMSRIQCVALSKSPPVDSTVAHLIIG